MVFVEDSLKIVNYFRSLDVYNTFILNPSVKKNVSFIVFVVRDSNLFCHFLNEPRRKKTGLRGFRPGSTQTGLYNLRSRLDA